jgi:hypothetical protein
VSFRKIAAFQTDRKMPIIDTAAYKSPASATEIQHFYHHVRRVNVPKLLVESLVNRIVMPSSPRHQMVGRLNRNWALTF